MFSSRENTFRTIWSKEFGIKKTFSSSGNAIETQDLVELVGKLQSQADHKEVKHIHLHCSESDFITLSETLDCFKQEQFYEYVYDTAKMTYLQGGFWLLKREFKDGTTESRIKYVEKLDDDIVKFSLVVNPEPNFFENFSIKMHWLTTRFWFSKDLWVDTCSWRLGTQIYGYNIITCNGEEAYKNLQQNLKKDIQTPSKAVVCLHTFYPELLTEILGNKVHEMLCRYIETAEVPTLGGANVFGFLTHDEVRKLVEYELEVERECDVETEDEDDYGEFDEDGSDDWDTVKAEIFCKS